jgi:exodeoxyribonuclease-3
MRLITWNCQAGLVSRKKALTLFERDPDIAIVQECSKRDTESIRQQGYGGFWFGDADIPAKGMAIFHKSEWKLHPLKQPKHKWIVPVDVEGPENFMLLAVWACAVKGKLESYVAVIHSALAAHPEWFKRGPVVMAGDFNSNSQWDRNRPLGNHTLLVEQLKAYGMSSVYHLHHKEEQGKESRPTFYLYRKSDHPFHLDYIFVPDGWIGRLKNFEVGDFYQWLRLSDHCPLTIDVASS